MEEKSLNDLYLQEITELTDLLNTEWDKLKSKLESRHLNLKGAYLVGFIEGEDDSEYGVLLLANNEIILFEGDENTQMTITKVDDYKNLLNDFPQLKMALTLLH